MPRGYGSKTYIRMLRGRRRVRSVNYGRKYTRALILKHPRAGLSNKGFFKLKMQFELVTLTTTGVINRVLSVHDPENATDWSNVSTLYDQYRVNCIKLELFPRYQYDESTTNPNNFIGVAIDWDSNASTIADQSTLIQYENCKFYNMKNRWKRVIRRIPRLTQSGATSNNVIYQGGYLDIGNPTDIGRIFFYANGLQTSGAVQYMQGICTYYITAKNRR